MNYPELKYDNGFLLDDKNNVVMSIYEEPIMKIAAEIITRTGGDILNIGFGLGIIDHFIQLKKPKSHTIIESHTKLYKEALKNGCDKNVNFINDKWSNVIDDFIKEGKKFDGIYFDTFNYDHNVEESRGTFLKKVKYILKKDGVFSYFLNEKTNEQSLVDFFSGEEIYDVRLINLNIDYDDRKVKNKNGYKIRKEHYIPIVRFK